jgi:hypothetical protein
MKVTNLIDELEKIEFVKRAAKRFSENKELSSYTDSDIASGCWFAVRWGLLDDCVLVFKVDENFAPEIFGQVIERS